MTERAGFDPFGGQQFPHYGSTPQGQDHRVSSVATSCINPHLQTPLITGGFPPQCLDAGQLYHMFNTAMQNGNIQNMQRLMNEGSFSMIGGSHLGEILQNGVSVDSEGVGVFLMSNFVHTLSVKRLGSCLYTAAEKGFEGRVKDFIACKRFNEIPIEDPTIFGLKDALEIAEKNGHGGVVAALQNCGRLNPQRAPSPDGQQQEKITEEKEHVGERNSSQKREGSNSSSSGAAQLNDRGCCILS